MQCIGITTLSPESVTHEHASPASLYCSVAPKCFNRSTPSMLGTPSLSTTSTGQSMISGLTSPVSPINLNFRSANPTFGPIPPPPAAVMLSPATDRRSVPFILCQTLFTALKENTDSAAPLSSNTLITVPGSSTNSTSMYVLLNCFSVFSFTAACILRCLVSVT